MIVVAGFFFLPALSQCLFASSKTFLFELFLSMDVVAMLKDFLNPLSWNASNLLAWDSAYCTVSKPYANFEMTTALKTCNLHLIAQFAFFPESFNAFHTGYAAEITAVISSLPLTFSLTFLPRYVASPILFSDVLFFDFLKYL